jgi:negative regulator of flagellin synthesis FlgM
MKINDIRQYGAISNYSKNTETKSASSPKKKTVRKDEVQISSEAKQLAQQFTAQVTSEERSDTIKRLKEAIANKSYHVDAELLADRMLKFFKNNSI